MTLLDKLDVQNTYRLRMDPFAKSMLDIRCEPTGITRPMIDRHTQYLLSAMVTVEFWANTAQYEGALKLARRRLIAEMYSDILVEIPRLMHAINDGNRDECFKIASRIKRTIEDES